jgi:hypothetical protein
MSARPWPQRSTLPTPILPESELLSENVVRLPAHVDEPGYFAADPGVTFDLSQVERLTTRAIGGLIPLLRKGTVRLLVPAGPVLVQLRRFFWQKIRHTGGISYEISLQ